MALILLFRGRMTAVLEPTAPVAARPADDGGCRHPHRPSPGLSPVAPRAERPAAARNLLVVFALLAANFLVYGQTLTHAFITFDDAHYVVDNQPVRQGLSLEGLRWALTTFEAANWHPLTWWSLQLDAELFGLNAGGYHLTNLLLHQACTLLAFFWLRAATGAFWRAAAVAAFFAVHPLHVESVAWVAERKDVLSALFFLLTLMAYTRWAQRGGTGRYLLTLAVYALGLMAKPMLVTLPAVLLLVDAWPLGRFGHRHGSWWRTLGRRVSEKVPFLALTVASCVVTFVAQRAGGAVVPLQQWTLTQRVSNAVLGYGDYLRLTFAPGNLSVFYPERGEMAWAAVLGVAALLAAVSAGAWALRRRAPYLLVGWLWFVGMMVPVIGLVQVGGQAIADRYTYLPHLGLFTALAWGGAAVVRWAGRPFQWAAAGATVLALCGLSWRAGEQTAAWRDSVTLYQHSLAAVGPVSRLYQMLGDAALDGGAVNEAEAHYQRALTLAPRDAHCLLQLGTVRLLQGNWQESADLLRRVLPHKANNPVAFNNFGLALRRLGGHDEMAIRAFERSLKLRADNEAAHLNLAEMRQGRGEWREAAEHYEGVLALRPDHADVLLRLAWLRATCPDAAVRDGARALTGARRATVLVGGNVRASVECYAAAHAELGQWPEARAAMEVARAAAEAEGGIASPLAEERRRWEELIRREQPLRF